jgi:ribosomal protein S1
MVRVIDVDLERKRISLSMREGDGREGVGKPDKGAKKKSKPEKRKRA